jgi:hypothetical protein
MMKDVIDYSVGFTQEEVEAILAVQKKELLKTQAAYASDNSSVNKRRIEEIHSIIRACQDALKILAPGTYGKRRRMIQAGMTRHLER